MVTNAISKSIPALENLCVMSKLSFSSDKNGMILILIILFSQSDISECSKTNSPVRCDENIFYQDCGNIKDSLYENYGCTATESEIFDYFDCANRMDKVNILFTKPPVIAKKTYQATNYNQVLLYDDTSIYCGTHNFTYEYFHDARYEFEEEPCNLLNGRNVSISTLWLDLKMDFSFEMSPILDKL